MYIKGLRTVAGPAQYTLFVTESSTAPTQLGDHDCDAGEILGTRLVYMSGPGTQDITLGSGIGLHVTKGDYVYRGDDQHQRCVRSDLFLCQHQRADGDVRR